MNLNFFRDNLITDELQYISLFKEKQILQFQYPLFIFPSESTGIFIYKVNQFSYCFMYVPRNHSSCLHPTLPSI